MSVGFRKSLFGFNSSDVIEYIEKTVGSFSKKEAVLNQKLDELTSELKVSNENCLKLENEKAELNKKLEEFNEKYEEIERLSENIGKLYLVAQANSKAIMENTENSADVAQKEVYRNLTSIDQAHRSLEELRLSIAQTSEEFTRKVDGLISSLNTARDKIAQNNSEIDKSKEQFREVFMSVTE